MPDAPFSLTTPPPSLPGRADVSPDPQPAGAGFSWPLPSVDFVDDGLGGCYVGFGMTVGSLWLSGLSFSPVAGGRRSANVFWRTQSESSYKVITFAISRADAIPKIPHVSTGTDNDVLMQRFLGAAPPQDTPDGGKVYLVVGQYLYGQVQPEDLGQPFLVPNGVLRAPVSVQLDPSQFTRFLTGPATVPPEYTGQSIKF